MRIASTRAGFAYGPDRLDAVETRSLVVWLLPWELGHGVPRSGAYAERDDLVGHLAGYRAHLLQRAGMLDGRLEAIDGALQQPQAIVELSDVA